MRGQEDRAALLPQLADDVPKLPSRLGIEPRGRFVEKQQFGIADQSTRHRQPLLLAAREFADSGRRFFLQPDPADRVVRPQAVAVKTPEKRERLAHRQLFGKFGFLERDADPLLDRIRIIVPAPAEDFHIPRCRVEQPFEDLDRRGLACPVGPQKSKALARRTSRSRPRTASTGGLPS